MNVAALLHDAPSDDHRRRKQHRDQQQQHSPERERDRQPPPPNPQPQHQQQRQPQSPQHSPQPPFFHQHSPRHARPPSPPRSYSQDAGNMSQTQRLPPPSAIMGMADPYDVRHRRPESEPMSIHHDIAMRSHHGPPPSHAPQSVPSQPFTLEHRNSSRSQPPPPHSQHHGHSQTNTPSAMYAQPPPPPPSSRSMHSLPPSKNAGSPPSHGSGSVPLYPTPVGPGMGPPPPPHLDHRGPPTMNYEPSIMYSGNPHAPPGASIMGALPPLPSSSSSHPHGPPHPHPHPHSHSQSGSRHRRTSSGGGAGYQREGGSPAMSSLQRSYDERDRIEREREGGPGGRRLGPQGPSPQLASGVPGPTGSSASSSMMPMVRGGPPPPSLGGGLSGPGATGVHAERERERERERDREREREREMGRERERLRERELSRDGRRDMERERERERDRMERHREQRVMDRHAEERMRDREREMTMDEVEREREWARKMQAQGQAHTPTRSEAHIWSRFTNPYSKMVDEAREREAEARERDLVREKFPEMEDVRMREEWEERERYARQAVLGRPLGRERDVREKEREKESDRDTRHERPKEPRRVSREEHGWLPEPRIQEGWPKELEREKEKEMRERERMHMQRERERELERDRQRDENDPLRTSRQHPPGHHHLHHHRGSAPSSQGHGMSKSTKLIRSTDPEELPVVPSRAATIPPGGMPPPFAPVMVERPLHGPNPHKPVSSKGSSGLTGPIPGQQPPMSQIPSQHLHPSHHPFSHPHAPLLGFPHRRSSPAPFTNTLAPSGSFLQPHSPQPPLPPTLPPLHLGTFVYPHTPFPFLDFSPPPTETPTVSTNGQIALAEKEVREIRATIYIPCGFLPIRRPSRPRIWGGALIPSFIPLFATPQLVNHSQSGMPYQLRRPHPLEINGLRRVYTDDSDLFLCALHAGWVKWSSTRVARKEGRDLRMDVRLTREARYVGGFGSPYVHGPESGVDEDLTGEDDGRTLLSAGWGNSHDGSGLEILNAEFVKRGTAHSVSLRNRAQRVLEYTDRHFALTCTRQSRKRRRLLYEVPRVIPDTDDVDPETEVDDVPTDAERSDANLCSSRTIVLGGRIGWSHAGFVYHPDTVKGVLFPPDDKLKGSKDASQEQQMDVEGADADAADTDTNIDIKPPSLFIHTRSETFLIYPQTVKSSSDGKENPHVVGGVLRYTIAVVTKITQTGEDAVMSGGVPPATATASASPPAAEPTKGAATDESEDMSISPSESSKPSVNGDTEPSVEGAPPATEDKTAEVPKELSTADDKSAAAAQDKDQKAPSKTDAPEEGASKETTGHSKLPSAALEPEPMDNTGSTQPRSAPPTAETLSKKATSALQVLQRDLTEDEFVFDLDGVGVVSKAVENDARKGWKIEVKSWRMAGADADSLIGSIV